MLQAEPLGPHLHVTQGESYAPLGQIRLTLRVIPNVIGAEAALLRTPADDDQGSMAGALQVRHGHDGEEAANVQAPGRRVIADVKSELLSVKTLA